LPIQLPEGTALELPIDQLGLIVLRDLVDSKAWNQMNYIREAEQFSGYEWEASRALAEALAWLRARGLIASDPAQSSYDAIFVTRTGKTVVEKGPDAFYATERFQRGTLHPLVEETARPQFLMGAYELVSLPR